MRVRVFLDQYRSAAVLPAFCSHHTGGRQSATLKFGTVPIRGSNVAVNWRLGKQLDPVEDRAAAMR